MQSLGDEVEEVTVVARRQGRYINEQYVIGNNAVAYDYVPENVPGHGHLERRLPDEKVSINPACTLGMMLLLFLMLLICVMMLKAQFTVASTSEQVIELKKELTAIRRENAHLESIIHEELDLIEIKRIAMEEYGMVFPSSTEVIMIKPDATSYTVQHRTIRPQMPERASIGNILAFITRGW